MRILYWTSYFLPDIGGVEVLSGHLVPRLAARGHELLVVASYGDQGRQPLADFQGVTVRRMNFEAVLYQKDLERLTRMLDEVAALKQSFCPDIIHLHTYSAGALFHFQTRTRFPAPEIYTIHSLPSTGEANGNANGAFARCLRSAQQVVAISKAMWDGAIALAPEVRAKSTIIPNGLPMPSLPPAPLDFRQPTLLAYGRAVPEKGFDLALRAFARVKRRYATVRLLIAGDGSELPALRRLAVELGVAGAVEFLGWVPPHSIARTINLATLVLAPSRWQEPFGLMALEAAQMARPVVATRVGGLPEVVLHGETGLLVGRDDDEAMAEAICTLLANPSLCRSIGRKARQRAAERFDIDRMVDAYESLYRLATAGTAAAEEEAHIR